MPSLSVPQLPAPPKLPELMEEHAVPDVLATAAAACHSHFMSLLVDCCQKLAQAHVAELQKVLATGSVSEDAARFAEKCRGFPHVDAWGPVADSANQAIPTNSQGVHFLRGLREKRDTTAEKSAARHPLNVPNVEASADVAALETTLTNSQGVHFDTTVEKSAGRHPLDVPNVEASAEVATLETTPTNRQGVHFPKSSSLREKRCTENRRTIAERALSAIRHTLDVTIVEATGLRDADAGCFCGSSDPYVVCTVRGKPETCFQTKVVMNDLNPVWNHEAKIDNFQEGDVLEFHVYDKDNTLKGDDSLGIAHLYWDDVHRHDGFFGSLQLSSSGYAPRDTGLLIVQVQLKSDRFDATKELAKLDILISAAHDSWPLIDLIEFNHQVFGRPSTRANTPLPESADNSSHGATIQASGCTRFLAISPFGVNFAVWHLLGIVCVLGDVFLVPMMLVFDLEGSQAPKYISFAMAVYWTVSIPRSFVTGAFMKGVVEMRISKISTHYLKTWFLPDMALVLIDLLGLVVLVRRGQAGSETSVKMVRVFRAVRFTRALGLLRLAKVHEVSEKYFNAIALAPIRCFLNVTGIVIVMLIFCHYIGCIWYYIGVQSDVDGWVMRLRQHEQGTAYEYMSSIHWALTQFMPASSGIQAGNLEERAYVFAVDVFGFVCFSFFVSNVQMQLNALKNHNADRHRQMAEMQKFFGDKNVPLSVSSSIMEFFRKQQRVKRNMRIEDVQGFKALPIELLRKLHTEVHRPLVTQHPFMRSLAKVDARTFSRICKEAVCERPVLQGCKLFEQDANAESMHFVTQGKFLYSRHVHAHDLQPNDWVSEPAVWINGWTHRGNLTATRDSLALEVSAGTFANILLAGGERSRKFTKAYASNFVRGGDHDEERLSFSDVWGTLGTLRGFAKIGEKYAVSA